MGSLEEDLAEEFERHYLACEQCQAELELSERLLNGFSALRNEEAQQRKDGEADAMRPSKKTWSSRRPTALAASVLIAGSLALNVGTYVSLEKERAQSALREASFSRPKANPQILHLSPLRSTASNWDESPFQLTRQSEFQRALFILAVPRIYAQYQVFVKNAASEAVLEIDGLHANSNEQIEFHVSATEFDVGTYTIFVEGREPSQAWESAVQYEFVVNAPLENELRAQE